MKLSIVIPAHNEESSLAETVEMIVKTLSDAGVEHEIVIVNDNSSDRTEQVCEELAGRHAQVRWVHNSPPHGFGFAVRRGLADYSGDAVAVMMADASDEPRDLVAAYRKLSEGFDCVFGTRFSGGGRVVDYPGHKLILNRFANWFIALLFRTGYNDTTNAFKLYRRRVIDGIQPLLSNHFNLTVEMPLKAMVRGFSFTVIPMSWYNRKSGISKLRIQEMGSRYLFIVLYVWLEKHLSRGDYNQVVRKDAERVVIFGGAGFVGSSVALGLRTSQPTLQITCADSLRRRGSELNLPRLKAAGIEFIHADIRIADDLAVPQLAADIYIDCSAEPSVLAGFDQPSYVIETNLLGTINVLELARRHRASLIFYSTSRVYSIHALRTVAFQEEETRFVLAPHQGQGGISEAGVAEGFSTRGQRSLYGTTKLASELLIEEYRESYGIGAIINRCAVIAGPWQMGKIDQGVFVLWMAAHHFQKRLSYIGYGGTGKQVRDVLHIDDLVSLTDYELRNFPDLDGQLFNVGGGLENSLSLQETTQLCRELSGNSIPIGMVEETRRADVPIYITDNSRVTEATGWRPKWDPRTTMTDIYDWLIKHEELLKNIL